MKRLFIFLLLPFFTTGAMAQTSIWKVSKGGNEIYLGGSVHLLKESDYPLPEEFDAAFALSQKMVFETNIGKLEDPQMAQKVMAKAMIEDNKTLSDILSEDVYKALEAETAKMSLPIAALERFKPSMVIVTMSGIQMQKMGITADGVDKHYYNKSNAEGKELAYLETVDEQLDVLMNMGKGNEDEFVKYSISDMNSMDDVLNDLIATWKDGSSKVMKEQLKEMEDSYPDIYESLLVNRKNNWMPKIEDYFNDDQTEFVVVGSLHLHGKDGLLQMLKDKGYKVKQFKP